jgi:two-component system, LytTR family, response regulator LytT
MHILIVEDEPLAAKRLYSLIVEQKLIADQVSYCDSIESAVKFLKQSSKPDLIFMDIELADGRSFGIFSQVEVKSPVIFTTAYDEHALEAFKVNSIDYLLKPIDPNELERALDKWKNLHDRVTGIGEMERLNQLISGLKLSQEFRSRILINKSDSLIPLDIDEVAWFYAEDKLNFLGTFSKEVFSVNQTLDELQRELDPKVFHRANRSIIIHRKSIVKASFHFNGKLKLHLKPEPEMDVYVSRERASAFKTWLGA